MPRILIVDNGTTLLKHLSAILPGEHVVVSWSELSVTDSNAFDAIILSGGGIVPVMGNEETFQKEMELIRMTVRPVLGICLGFELIVRAFGGTLMRLPENIKGVRTITPTNPSEYLTGIDSLTVYENHAWIVEALPTEFSVIADSITGPEVIVHSNQKRVGLQFHPEVFADGETGYKVLGNILHVWGLL